jgi:antitoxin YefM
MSHHTTLTEASQALSSLCDRAISDREIILITRPDGEQIALIAVDELSSILETAHLLRSPNNAARILEALEETDQTPPKPQSVESFRQELGFSAAE